MNDPIVPVSCFALLAAAGLAAPAFAAPVNDTRAAAIPITLGNSYAGTTVAAANEGGFAAPCGDSAASPDVWYRFDPLATVGVTVTTCGGASFDTVLTAFQAGPGGTLGTELVCLDDGSDCGTQTRISFNATAGNTFWIRVTGYRGATGTFTLATSETVPVPPTPGIPPAHSTQAAPPGGMPTLPATPTRTTGPDVTVGNLIDTAYYGGGSAWMADSNSAGLATDKYSYAVGTDSWNIGDRPVEWQASNQLHPVIGQQMYRWKDGRFEQIGISWLKHGFSSTNSGAFPDMGACDGPPSGSAQLGVNCSDAYGSGLNGGRSYLGPRFDVNPTTGVYTYPWSSLVGTYINTDPIARRLVVSLDDVRGDTNAGAYYFVDCVYSTQDDAQWGNGRNNYSARLLQAGTLFNNSVQFLGSTYRRTTALELWARMDPAVTLSNVDMVEQTMNVTDKWRPWTPAVPDAIVLPTNQWVTSTKEQPTRFIVASKAIDKGNGTWDYEYAVMNLNSRRSGGSFAVRVPANGAPTNIAFHAPKYHSGERVLNNPWTNNGGAGGKVSWAVNPATASLTVPGMASPVTFGPNALGYGTLYNFRFQSSAAPTTGSAQLGLFRAPNATGYQGMSLAVSGIKVPTICKADVGSQGGISSPDGMLDNNDFIAFIDAFFNEDMLMADLGAQGGLSGPDGMLDNNDFIVFINAFFDGCGV